MTMDRSKIGSYAWSERSGGILTFSERIKLLNMLVKSQAIEAASKLKHALGGYGEALNRFDVERVAIPDTVISNASTDVAQQLYSKALLNHCLRTYVFGVLFSMVHRKKVDLEVLYVGCMLHDVGLTTSHRANSEAIGFQVVGAQYAYDFAIQHAQSHERAIQIYESISFHLNPYLSIPTREPEAAFLQRGAMLDVIGANKHLLGKDVIQEVLFNYPRESFKEEILDSMRNIKHARCSHAHVLGKCGFEKLAENNPLNSY